MPAMYPVLPTVLHREPLARLRFLRSVCCPNCRRFVLGSSLRGRYEAAMHAPRPLPAAAPGGHGATDAKTISCYQNSHLT